MGWRTAHYFTAVASWGATMRISAPRIAMHTPSEQMVSSRSCMGHVQERDIAVFFGRTRADGEAHNRDSWAGIYLPAR